MRQQSETNPLISVEQRIEIEMDALGISPALRGYHFIKAAVLMILADGSSLYKLNDKVYLKIASTYYTTPRRVSLAVKYAISAAWTGENAHALRSHYADSAVMPTSSEFFTFITKRVAGKAG